MLKILSAKYGLKDDPASGADVTAVVQKAASKHRLVFVVTNENIGSDPYPGQGKRLLVQYEIDGVAGSRAVGEGKTLRVPTDHELKAKK